jgi:hypothetical protein
MGVSPNNMVRSIGFSPWKKQGTTKIPPRKIPTRGKINKYDTQKK